MSAAPPVTPKLKEVLTNLGFVSIIGFLLKCKEVYFMAPCPFDAMSINEKEIWSCTGANLYTLGVHIARVFGYDEITLHLLPHFQFLPLLPGLTRVADPFLVERFQANGEIKRLMQDEDPFTMEIFSLLKRAKYEADIELKRNGDFEFFKTRDHELSQITARDELKRDIRKTLTRQALAERKRPVGFEPLEDLVRRERKEWEELDRKVCEILVRFSSER